MAEGELHKKIKEKAVEYLMNQGYRVAKSEVNSGYYGIFDAWGIKPLNLYTKGIEVKVSRADWRAAKYKDYRANLFKDSNSKDPAWSSLAANEIFIACPAGLITPEDLKDNMHGLLWYMPSGRFVNKKQPYFVKSPISAKMRTLLSIYEPFYHASY